MSEQKKIQPPEEESQPIHDESKTGIQKIHKPNMILDLDNTVISIILSPSAVLDVCWLSSRNFCVIFVSNFSRSRTFHSLKLKNKLAEGYFKIFCILR